MILRVNYTLGCQDAQLSNFYLYIFQRMTHLEFLQLFEGFVTVLVGHVDACLQLLQVQLQLLTCCHGCGTLLPLVLQLHFHLPDLKTHKHI